MLPLVSAEACLRPHSACAAVSYSDRRLLQPVLPSAVMASDVHTAALCLVATVRDCEATKSCWQCTGETDKDECNRPVRNLDEAKSQHEAKRGAHEKVNSKLKTVPLDRFLEKKSRTGARSGTGVVCSSVVEEREGFLPEANAPESRLENGADSLDSKVLSGISLLSSWTNNEGLDSETGKISSEPGSEMSSPASEQEQAENDKVITIRKKQKKRNAQPSPATYSLISQETKDLQWDYTNTQLKEASAMHGNTETQPSPVSLKTIDQSIMEHQEESKTESRRNQSACRKMQTQIRRVAKTCSEFATRIGEVENRISRLEDDLVCSMETDGFRR
ncbi:hypothetical protein NDU88_002461 [Pleurodeles waltl]|uniref:Uncharacterized protein n=1 Tax=Pleurodeles waltl TaxID=8319 RepID=A0AAV7UX53_PLEWA|nr:hypothetical protein NDU88_002461 [Pleurodeles waltl]